jgi:hypothetical protein
VSIRRIFYPDRRPPVWIAVRNRTVTPTPGPGKRGEAP